jgi:4-amino-4-deoxy-L-arabinose transferase-like glycosyltransferase
MASTPISLPGPRRARVRARGLPFAIPAPELGVLLVLAGALYLWALDRNGYANLFYSAAVRSMSTSWHAFLYDSFDARGLMTVDKPPLAPWVEALSARVFGFSPWSLLVPQALMGVATVGLAHDLTRRRFGRAAGFAAGLALACTPITVAIARHNNPDALLALCCTAALWCVVRAFEDGGTRWIVLAGVAVGLGFETKLAAALLVVPAIAAAWLWVAPRGRLAAVGQLLAGGVAMTAVGLAWPVLMWLTPAADRPWISGTADNSIWSLIVGYDGLGRLVGQRGGGNGALFGGPPGPLRLLDRALGGQVGWLLAVAVAGGLGLLAVTWLRRADPRTGWLLLVGGAFLTIAVAFSSAHGIFLPYYVSLLAPFAAALVGAACALILGRGAVARATGAVAVAACAIVQIGLLRAHPASLAWWPPLLASSAVLGVAALAAAVGRRARAAAAAGAIALLVLAPAAWAVATLQHPTDGPFPVGGPAKAGIRARGPAPASPWLNAAIAYAGEHGGGALAVASQSRVARTLIASRADVVGIGGYSGRETQVTSAWLADAVRAGEIRYVLAPFRSTVPVDGRIGATRVMSAVEAVGKPVRGIGGLYDMRGRANRLR